MDFGFPAVLALLFLMADSRFLGQTLAVCLIHEGAHGIVMALTGAGIGEIRLHAAGIQMRAKQGLLSIPRELAVRLSGPAANLLTAALLHRICPGTVVWQMHLAMGLFNLLPFRALDGGAALDCILNGNALRFLPLCNVFLAAAGIILLLCFHAGSPALYAMGLYLAVSEGMEFWR